MSRALKHKIAGVEALIKTQVHSRKYNGDLREYITDYINGKSIVASDLYPIKEFIQHLKFQKLLDRYDDLYSMDMFGESIEGHKYKKPFQFVKRINPNTKEDMELLREVLRNNHFDD